MLCCSFCSNDILNGNYLQCTACKGSVHVTCHAASGTPSKLFGDVFYNWTCVDCTPQSRRESLETFERQEISPELMLVLAIYNLQIVHTERFFHFENCIKPFIEERLQCFFSENVNISTNILEALETVLMSNEGVLFTAGRLSHNTDTFWALADNDSPPRDIYEKYLQQKILNPENTCESAGSLKRRSSKDLTEVVVLEKLPRVESEAEDDPSCTCARIRLYTRKKNQEVAHVIGELLADSVLATGATRPQTSEQIPIASSSQNQVPNKVSETRYGIVSVKRIYYDDADNRPDHEAEILALADSVCPWSACKNEVTTKPTSTELPSWQPTLTTNRIPGIMPWAPLPPADKGKRYRSLTVQEEDIFYEKLKNAFLITRKTKPQIPDGAWRMYRILCARKWEREHNCPAANRDEYINGDAIQLQGFKQMIKSSTDVIARYTKLTAPTQQKPRNFYERLMGSAPYYEHIISPYSGRALPPVIFQSRTVFPPWLKLMCHLKFATSGEYTRRCLVDFVYVQPNHIPAVNSLLSNYFWPDINISDSLRYPDFSVVALYKKLVIGCGFLVPDSSTNEAYLPFMAVRPHWQRSGIGKFMLYHLIQQTCQTKDITLHVPEQSDGAVSFYKKFGFKIEKRVLNFYDKYTHSDCNTKHLLSNALFMRLPK